MVLRPCHICHRRPTTRRLLDAYADCGACGERACFICMRECDSLACARSAGVTPKSDADIDYCGSSTPSDDETDSKRKICSRCAVEGITDTGVEVVRCLDCARGFSAAWSAGSMAYDWADKMNVDDMRA